MKKEGLLFAFFLVLTGCIALASAQTNGTSTDEIAKSYQCLEKQIAGRSSLSLQEATFGVLALGNAKNASETIGREKHTTNACWPKAGCTLRETAQVALAKQRLGENTDAIEAWLRSRNGTATDLAWFIEIDTENQQPSACTIKYDGKSHTLQMQEDMRITGNPGACLTISSSDYLLKIRETCLEKTFDISCNQSFISTVVYQKNKGDGSDCLDQNNATCFVSSETHAASSLGTTQERVNAYCFKTGTTCDYEGSLWATLALARTGNSISTFVPYVLALAEDNQRYFPEAFLSIFLADDVSYSQVIESRKQGVYWELVNSPYNRFYDTALGLLALSSSSANAAEVDATQEYLLSIRTREGCWNNNNIRDTAFLLYAGWARGVVPSGGGTSSSAFCEDAGFSCERANSCLDSGGTVKQGFECTGVGVCCSISLARETCKSQNGVLCSAQQECDGSSFESSEGACCLGACLPITLDNVCEQQSGGTCKASCNSDEEPTSDSCGRTSGSICCIQKEDDGSSVGLIIALIILIILVALAIFYRHKIQMWWFSRKSGIKSTPVTKPGPPPSRPLPASRAPLPRFGAARQPLRASPRDRELEDTLAKLREMSK
ncbi:hypothetical protein HYZ97_04160 [Candidatus Pacearchaeota archaeon]|nr:hypothetical protein [Candidatus Pacearchaeota archaeon]